MSDEKDPLVAPDESLGPLLLVKVLQGEVLITQLKSKRSGQASLREGHRAEQQTIYALPLAIWPCSPTGAGVGVFVALERDTYLDA